MTHFVRIALVTRASLPKFLDSCTRFQRDAICAVIPKGAFIDPVNLHLTLGALNLPTPSHVETASNLLRSAIAGQRNQPLIAHVVGIGNHSMSRRKENLRKATSLYSRFNDPTGFLQEFCERILFMLRDAGLLKTNAFFTNIVQKSLQTRLVSTARLPDHPGGLPPKFDATEIHSKYKDYVWMKGVQLQELNITQIGRSKVLYDDVVMDGYRNSAKIVLPGAAGNGTRPPQTEVDARSLDRDPK